MTPAHLHCRTPAQIHAFLQGGLASLEEKLLQQHLNECVACRELLSQSAADDSSWLEAQEFFRGESMHEASLESVDSMSGSGEEPESIESILKLLGSTDDPRMLGRIGIYEIVGVLGRGGMGVVFKAYEPSLNRYVAIKLLLPHLAASGAARMRFAREGRAAAAVIDDNVLPIFSVAEWQGVPYLVAQLSRGTNLQKRISEGGPLELREILRLGMQTASGLAAAHAQGLVHRDVKPSNILLDGTVERALLTDFGLARAVDDASITCSGIIAGTPQYMSPEQARGGVVDARSDLFGLGVVLYTMCVGRPPFRADNALAVLRLITDMQPRPIREINPEIPGWLCAIIGKLMSKRPEDRYQSANEVKELLSACLAHVQQPTVVSLPSELLKTTQRGRLATGYRTAVQVTAAVIIGCVIVAFVSISLGLVKPPQPSRFGSTEWLNRSTAGTEVLEQKNVDDITGIIVDTDGKPMEQAQAFTEADPQIVTSNKEGGFRYPLAKGTQTRLRVFKPGYRTWFGTPTAGDRRKIVLEKRNARPGLGKVVESVRDAVVEKKTSEVSVPPAPKPPIRVPVTCVLTVLNKPGTVEVEVSVGLGDGIKLGDKLYAMQDGQTVGTVEITQAADSRSIARILEVAPGKSLKRRQLAMNDMAKELAEFQGVSSREIH